MTPSRPAGGVAAEPRLPAWCTQTAHPPARGMGRQYTPRARRWNTQSMRRKKRRERGGMAAGIAIGTGIGAAVGAATGQLAVWVGVGAGLGVALGAFLTAGLH